MNTSEARNWQQSWQEINTPNKKLQTDTKSSIKVKVNKHWITPGEKFIYTIFSLVLVAGLFLTVSFSANADSLNREVQKLEQSVSQQKIVNEDLQYKVKEYSNPDRILRIAKENGLKIQNTEVKQVTSLMN